MFPLPVSIFITQLVAFLGVAAIARIVILIAYYLKDIDVRLMYHENIFRYLEIFKGYDNSCSKKWLVIALSSIAFILSFLPTFFSITGDIRDAQHVSYTNIKTTDSPYYYLNRTSDSLANMPLFVNFYEYNQEPANLTGILLENYITSIGKERTKNPSGVWYNAPSVHFFPKQQLQRWANDANYPPTPQIVNDKGVFTLQQQDNQKPTYFLSYNSKIKTKGSSTLESCVDNDPLKTNIVNNLTSVEGHQVQAVHAYNRTCYPLTDPSLWLVAAQEREVNNADSSLNTMEDLYYRSAFLAQQSSASYSMGIVSSIWDYLNQKVMMIKTSAHITIYYDDNNRLLTQESCVPDTTSKLTFNQDINLIACQLVALAKQNLTLPMLQATKRTFESNRILNSVYTYVRKDNGHGIMIDLTQYSGYNVPKSMQDNYFDKEMFIGYQKIKKSNFETIDFEQLLQSINPFPDIDTEYGLNTINDLVLFGAGLLGNSYGNFLRTTAIVIPSVKVSTAWIAVTITFAVLFILIIAIASFLTPKAYKTDLRSLLIHTLITHEMEDTTDDSNLNRERKTCLFTRAVKLDGRESLKMDGTPIVLSENIPMANQETPLMYDI